MMEKTYLSAVQCRNCHSIRNFQYSYPSKKVRPFPEPCKCDNPDYVIIAGDTPDEWFAYQDKKRGNRQ